MLRQRSSEVMDRTCTRPPYALHAWLGVFQTIGYPPNWFFAHDNVASVQTVGENCTDCEHEECKYGAKKQRQLIGGGCIFSSEWARTFPGIRASNQSAAKAYCVACNTHFWYLPRRKTRREASHRAKAQSRLGSINRFVAAGCEIDKVTSAEIAFAIFIAKHNLPMAVGDEFGLLAKEMWCTTVPVAPPGGGKNTNYRFSRFFVLSVPLFRSLMLTPDVIIILLL